MRPDALVFDLEGTLIDSAADLRQTINELLREYDREPLTDDQLRPMLGGGIGGLVARAFVATGGIPNRTFLVEAASRFLKLYVDPHRPYESHVYPDVRRILNRFAADGIAMGLCTNKAQRPTEQELHRANLADFFSSVVGHDRAPRPKPDPAHVQCVLEQLGSPQSAIFVGDSANDLAAAHAAGLKAILVSYGYGDRNAYAKADAVIDSFEELPAAIEALLAQPSHA